MKLIEDLRIQAAATTSIFQRQLIKEDIQRLEKLEVLVAEISDEAGFKKSAMTLGWTPNDLRTFELNPELATFVATVWQGQGESEINGAWAALHKRRMDVLLGCLSRPRLEF